MPEWAVILMIPVFGIVGFFLGKADTWQADIMFIALCAAWLRMLFCYVGK